MSKGLINAAKLIKEECSKNGSCKGCFYGTENNDCTIDDFEYPPSHWDLSKLEEKE